MKKALIFFGVIAVSICEAQNKKQNDFAERIDKYMQAQVELNNFSGAVLLARNDTVLLEKGYGLADREWNVPNTADTKFRIASNTKQFTAACILQLEEQGKLSLDDSLGKYISGFKYGHLITIRMLLTHSSGLQEYSAYAPLNELRPMSFSRDSILRIFKSRPFDFLPGHGLMYSNTGYFLLGIIIEKASGQTYAEYLSQHVLKVAGMENTGVEESGDTILLKRARGYCRYPSGTYNSFDENYRQGILYSSGSLYSTVGDLYKWEKALRRTSIINEASRKKMFTPYGYSIAQQVKDTSKIQPFLYPYGFGVQVDTFMNHKRYWTGGSISGFLSAKFLFPDDNIVVIVLTNMEENPMQYAEPLSWILFGMDFTIPHKHTPVKINPDVLTNYVGKWKGKGAAVDVRQEYVFETIVKDHKLYRRRFENKPPPNNFQDQELIPESQTKFFYGDGQDKVFDFSPLGKEKANYIWLIKNGFKYRWERID